MFLANLGYTSVSIHQKLLENLRSDDRIQDVSSRFLSLSEPHRRVMYVYELIKIYQLLPLVIKEDKCEFTSCHYRNLGNKFYEKNKLYKAWQYYNLALMYSPLECESYTFAVSNRSAVLAGLKQYEACLEDIQLVFDMLCPSSLKAKLLKRKNMCLEALRSARNLDNIENNEIIDELFTLRGSKHKKYVDASSKLTVMHTPELGRHVIANEDIKVGEVIVQEDPYVNILLRDQIAITCAHCFSRNFNLYPCAYCCMAMYCSRKCVKAAWDSYHFYECPFLASLLDNKFTKLELLALRTTIKARTDHKKWEDVLKTVETAEGCTNIDDLGCHKLEDGRMVYASKKYESIHSLSTNLEKRDVSDMFQKTVTAAIFMQYLAMKNFIAADDRELRRKIKNFTATTLLQHLMTAPTNMHGITANVEDEDGNFVDEYNIGSGAYAFLSLINHSCAPNVVRYTRLGTTQTTLVALRPIKKGMQIYDNYGYIEVLREEEGMETQGIYKKLPSEISVYAEMASCGVTQKAHHAVHTKEDRQVILKSQYKFTCLCEACAGDWPLYEDLKTIPNMPTSIANKMKYLNGDVFEALKKAKVNDALELFKPLCKLATSLEQYAPCKEAADCQEALKQCLAILSGVLAAGFADYVEWAVPAPRRVGRPASAKFYAGAGAALLLSD